jgi:hypothetical protein
VGNSGGAGHCQVTFGDPVPLQWLGQYGRRRNRILNRQVDADAPKRRHRVRGIADAQQPINVPAMQPIHMDVEVLDVVHGSERRHRLGRFRY